MKSKNLLSINAFIKRIIKNLLIGMIIIAFSLGLGMLGYRNFEQMTWVSAYENAAMILAGMGPVDVIQTRSGKIFAGSYALFSGIIFLVVIAVIIAPLVHKGLHKFIIKEKVE